jgi:hypothetical protein
MPFDAFFQDIDRAWPVGGAGRIQLRLIGSTALMLQTDYHRGTNDSDVFETTNLARETRERLLALAGNGTPLHRRHRMYLDIVRNGVPFLPGGPRWHPLLGLNASLHELEIEIEVLDVVDVVVTKLKRFHANDQSDVQAMIDRNLVPHDALIARFRSAIDRRQDGADAESLPRYVDNLNRVERDMFGVDETEIELPDWI